jgi:hypothetical protein
MVKLEARTGGGKGGDNVVFLRARRGRNKTHQPDPMCSTITYARTVEMLSSSIPFVLQDRFGSTTDVTIHSSVVSIRDYSRDSLNDMSPPVQTVWSFPP